SSLRSAWHCYVSSSPSRSLITAVVTVRARGDRHVQVGAILRIGFDREVVQRDDPRQARNAAHEGTEVVVAAYHFDRDRQLDVELLRNFRPQRNRIELQAAAETGK